MPFSSSILTRSAVFEAVLRSAQLIAQTDASVLITGESGTGKELVARAMHAQSRRQHKPFITVNCAALPESLAESLLFGHRKGAFTGADTQQIGLIGAAEGGTLFLDEIGELPLSLQAKLLRFLESGEVLPLGEAQAKRVDVRIFAATHRDLYAMAQQGEFRQDLFYRLNIIPVELPALRERKEDIVPLAERFLEKYAARYHKGNMHLSPAAVSRLKEYSWPGNIRELQHTIEKAVIMAESDEPDMPVLGAGNARPGPSSTQQTLEQMECELIRQALEIHRGNMSAVAVQLGITRQTLYNKLRKYGL